MSRIRLSALSLCLIASPAAASPVSVLLSLMGKAVAAVSPPPATPAITPCSGLLAALAKAKGGETFSLPAGACNITSTIVANPAATVTITSTDPTHPAVLAYTAGGGAFMANSSNLAFAKLEMTTVGNPDKIYGFRMYGDTNISFVGVNVHGDAALAPGAQATAFYITPSAGVSFTGSTFHDMSLGISGGQIGGLTMTGNDFYNLSKGGVAIGQVSNLLFSGNKCHDFHIATLVHSDCLQLFTAGSAAQSHDIVITNNDLERAAGDGFQGLFLGDEANLGYKNVTVTGNTVMGGMWDSIYLDEMVGALVVTNNKTASWLGNSPEGGAGVTVDYRAFLTINNGPTPLTSTTISGNSAQAYTGSYFPNYTPPAGNVILGPVVPVPAS